MNVFEDHLTREIATAAQAVKLRPGRSGDALRLARRRQIRHRRAGALTATIVVIGATVGIVTIANRPTGPLKITVGESTPGEPSDESGDRVPAAPAPPLTVDVIPANLEPSPLTWQRAETADRPELIRTSMTVDAAGGDLYGVSTRPSVQHPGTAEAVVARSTDGVTWTDADIIPNAPVVDNLAVYNGSLYSVGTAPADQGLPGYFDLVARRSLDGSNWTTTVIPGVDLPALRTRLGPVSAQTLDIAAGPRGVVVAESVTTYLAPEVTDRLPADAYPELGFDVVPEGLRTYIPSCAAGSEYRSNLSDEPSFDDAAPEPTCVSSDDLVAGMQDRLPGRLVTWAELGVSSDDGMVYSPAPRFFVSTDGASFEPVTLPDLPSGAWTGVQLIADDDGFVALLHPQSFDANGTSSLQTVHVYTSADGRAWAQGPSLDGVGWLLTAARPDGVLTAVVDAAGAGLSVARLTDTEWTVTPAGDLLERGVNGAEYMSIGEVSVGPLGIAAAVNISPPDLLLDAAPRLVEHAKYALLALNDRGTVAVVDSSGAEVARVVRWGTASGTTGRAAMYANGNIGVLDASGIEIDLFTYAEMDTGMYQLQNSGPFTTLPPASAVATPTTPPADTPNVFDGAGPSGAHLAFSRDFGVTWSIRPVAELIGQTTAYIDRLVVTADAVVAQVVSDYQSPKVIRGTI